LDTKQTLEDSPRTASFSFPAMTQEKIRRIRETRTECREHEKRTSLMREHIGDVKREMDAVGERLRASRSALEMERHLSLLERSTRDRAESEGKRYARMIEHEKDRCRDYSRRIEENQRAIAMFEARGVNADEIRNIVEEQIDDDERDFETLARYELEDERITQSLELDLAKATEEAHRSHSEADDARSNLSALRCELQRVQSSLKDAHARQMTLQSELVNAQRTLGEREEAIEETLKMKDEVSRALVMKQGELRVLAEQLKHAELENKSLQSKVSVKEQLARRKAERAQELKENLVAATQALETAVHVRAAAARGAECSTTQRCQAEETLKAHEHARDEKARQVEKAKRELNDKDSTLAGAEEKLRRMQETRDEDLEALRMAQQELGAEKDVLFQVSEGLHETKERARRVEMQVQGAMIQNKQLSERRAASQVKLLKQREVLYTASLRMQQLERKIKSLEGVRSNEENERLRESIVVLQRTLVTRQSEHDELSVQVQGNGRKVARAQDEARERSAKASRAMESRAILEVEAEGSERREIEISRERDNLQVRLDLLRLKIARRHCTLYMTSGNAEQLAHREREVIREIDEAHANLRAERDESISRLRALQHEAHAKMMHVKHLEQRLEHLKSRLKVLRAKSPFGEDVNIEEQKDYLRIVERRREALADERADLLSQISNNEAELDELRRLLKDAEESNAKLRARLKRPSVESGALREEWAKTTSLLQTLRDKNDALEMLKEREKQIMCEIERVNQSLAAQVDEHNVVVDQASRAQRERDAVSKKYRAQKVKLRRAKGALADAVRAHRINLGLSDDDPPTAAEKHVRAQLLSESIRKAKDILGRRDERSSARDDSAKSSCGSTPRAFSRASSIYSLAPSTGTSVAGSLASSSSEFPG